MKRLRRLIRESGFLSAGTVAILFASNVVTLVWNTYISKIVDSICEKEPISAEVVGMAVLSILLSMAGGYAGSFMSGWTGETLNHNLRMDFTRYLLNQSLQETEELSVGGQMSLFQNEINEVSTYMSDSLCNFVNTILAFLLTIVFLWYQSPILTLVSNLPILLILLYVTVSSRIIAGYARKSQEWKQQMNGSVESMTEVMPILHLYDCASFLCRQYNQKVEAWQKAYIKEERVRAKLMSLSAVLSCIPLLLLLFTGGIMVIRGEITIGVVYIFINLSKNVSGQLMNLPGFIASYRRFLVNLDRIFDAVEV